jgi:hypothetical protein
MLTAFSLCSVTQAQAQNESGEQIKAKHDAYFLCLNNIETKPREAYAYCSSYLRRYPNDDPRLVEFATSFTTAFLKIDSYLKTIPASDFIDSAKWSIYKPDLQKAIPWTKDADSKHRIEISRQFASPAEDKILARAEATYRPRALLDAELLKQWRYAAQPHVTFPEGEPPWFTGPFDGILAASVVTASAIEYYYDISQRLRTDDALEPEGLKFGSTGLKYIASIKLTPEYSHGDKTFRNVYVAEMSLTWGQVCGGLCGYGFTRVKTVILDTNGEVLEAILDDPVNSSSWIS